MMMRCMLLTAFMLAVPCAGLHAQEPDTAEAQAGWAIFDLVEESSSTHTASWVGMFYRGPSLEVGVKVTRGPWPDRAFLPVDGDRLLYVVAGQGKIEIDGEDHDLQAGSIVYLRDDIGGPFHSIPDSLIVLWVVPTSTIVIEDRN